MTAHISLSFLPSAGRGVFQGASGGQGASPRDSRRKIPPETAHSTAPGPRRGPDVLQRTESGGSQTDGAVCQDEEGEVRRTWGSQNQERRDHLGEIIIGNCDGGKKGFIANGFLL